MQLTIITMLQTVCYSGGKFEAGKSYVVAEVSRGRDWLKIDITSRKSGAPQTTKTLFANEATWGLD